MQLILRVHSYCEQVPDNNRERSYDTFPIIIGRSTACHYILDDLSKYISSNHATVTLQGDQLLIQDTSSNGVYMNGSSTALGRGNSATLKHGDILVIGDYTLQAAVVVANTGASDAFSMANPTTVEEDSYDPWNGNEPDFNTESTPINHGSAALDDDWMGSLDRTQSGSSQPAGDNLEIDISGSDTDDDDWFDFAKTGKQTPVQPPAQEQTPKAAIQDTPASRPAEPSQPQIRPTTPDLMPDDSPEDAEDPFDWLSGTGTSEPVSPRADEFDPATTLDSVTPINGPGAVELADSQPPTPMDDPFADLTAPQVSPVADETPTVRKTSQAAPPEQQQPQNPAAQPRPTPRPPPQAQPPRQPPPSQVSGNSSVNSSGALSTVLQAAGLNPNDFAHLSEAEALSQVGFLLNQSVEGIMLLLQSRGEMKNAIRSDVTMLGSSNNNPLKFSFGSAEALTKLLLSANNPGYMDSDKAMTQAVDDLKIHQIAMLEAMRSAVRAMLAQFDPQRLEQKLEKNNPLAANIPIKREAKLWQLFQEKFSDIHEEAVSDFGEMFGSEFRKAYEKRLSELGRKPDF